MRDVEGDVEVGSDGSGSIDVENVGGDFTVRSEDTDNDTKDVFLWQRLALVTYKDKEGKKKRVAASAAREGESN